MFAKAPTVLLTSETEASMCASFDQSIVRPDLEAQFLSKVQIATSRSYTSVNEVIGAVEDPLIAEKVLPILASWMHLLDRHSNYRTYVYFTFGRADRAQAHKWFEEMFRWWQSESEPIAKTLITNLVAHYMHGSDGQRVWDVMKDIEFVGQTFLLARLARIPQVREDVVARIILDCERGKCGVGDLSIYWKIPDGRLRKSLVKVGARSQNRAVRQLTERMTQKSPQPPEWVRLGPGVGPSRKAEMYSAEVDLKTLDREVGRAGRKLGIVPRKFGRTKAFLAIADSNQWFVSDFGTNSQGVFDLWLRAEDQDVVELVVTASEGRIS